VLSVLVQRSVFQMVRPVVPFHVQFALQQAKFEQPEF
jgi:hypothetical protein